MKKNLMKKNPMKKGCVTVLILAMTFAMVGCGDDSEEVYYDENAQNTETIVERLGIPDTYDSYIVSEL